MPHPIFADQERLDALFVGVSEIDAASHAGEHATLTGEDVRALREALFVDSLGALPCACRGDVTLSLKRAAEREEMIGHHGESIVFGGTPYALDGERFLRFLAEHGVSQPLRRYEEIRALAAQSGEDRAEWILDAPPILRTALDALETGALPGDEAVTRLSAEYPTAEDAVRALFAWIGNRVDWRERPAYELVGSELLKRFPRATLISAASAAEPYGAAGVGAARYFALAGVRDLPAALREDLRRRAATQSAPNLAFFDERTAVPR